ncbi:hypothetical protein COU89_00075 [Candidatus Roizmanbacteria bacterium CG10_big_fil_rev_8_21_14_0_10_45_7]|uniref:Urease accessory protein UreH-like transmembrane domain-containing protein n=1 Tax=Candidatus Roizmanbacteria bacterium CG10_big_fil_rev_8_21_14_0_10_45_7 TaxID=1974854 RepID=A0A2M8KVR8_9BACT|nr:MAG: hypothetical protein COU89_00075 [Candidatus Roizmanbacteria bacterium CG10_big_fil_rev_8_21_14_0_10_45_7]
MPNLWIIFLTGLTVGGLTCLAVQGGLLASIIAAKKDKQSKHDSGTVYPTLAFLLAKLVAYTVLGFLLGAFGGAIGINETAQITIQFIAGLYMIVIALNLLDVHPLLRYAVIQPPQFLTRSIKRQSRSRDMFAPALLGAMTVFIPCGTTLAMEALAISSASPLLGAAIMAVFVLGTTPLFFGIGWLTSLLGDTYRSKFLKIAALAVIYLGVTSMNGALVAAGSPIALRPKTTEKLYNEAPVSQTVEIRVTASGYSPNYVRVKKGSLVTVKLVGQNAYSCASAFRAPTLGINKNLQPNESYTFTFTPKETGKIPFACSMGMYGGVIEVI